MDRRRSLLKIAALRSERERQAGVKMGYNQYVDKSASTMFKSPSMPIGTNDFTLEYFGNLYGAISSNTPLIFNTNAPYAYSKGCLLVYGTSQIAVRWIIFEKPSSGDLLLDSIDLIEGAQESILHIALTRKGTTVKIYINGELKATKEQSAVKDLGDFRLGMANSSEMVMSRIYNYALSAEEVAAHYNGGDPAGYILPQNLKNIKDMAFTSKTFEFDMDSPYYQRVLESGELESGRKYRVDYVVEEWDIAPAVIGSCGISCGVLSTVGTQYWPNISAAKLGENQYVVVDTKETGAPYMFVYASNPSDTYTSRRLKVTVHSVKMLGCIAEYLPQNLVRSPCGDPVEIVGENSHTWTGVDDPVSFNIKINRVLSVGGAFRITGSVSNYKSGTPYLNLGNSSIAYLPKDNSPFTLVVTLKEGSSTLLPYIYIYGGSSSEDKQLTITVDSIEPVSDVALSWLDSSKNLPLNDEYLPPLFESIVIGDATPIHITGENSYTWTGADDSTYGKLIPISRTLNVGSRYRISVTVSDYEAGSPFINISGTDSASIPSANGTYELELAYTADYPNRIILYGGQSKTDRRLTLTVNSIEPIVEHSYDLTANGMPQIIIK